MWRAGRPSDAGHDVAAIEGGGVILRPIGFHASTEDARNYDRGVRT